MFEVKGYVHPRFAAVKEAFANNFDEFGEVGAACAIYYQGQCVVDVWAGLADDGSQRAWEEDTLQLIFSSTKGITATCIHHLVAQGKLDIDQPVAAYWPEFAASGKADITTRMVLSHRAGLAAVEGGLSLEDIYSWSPVVDAIAAQSPNWEPGTAHGYHARSFGWILGELVRRISGSTIGQYLRDNIADPLGLNLWIGLPEDLLSHVAPVIPPEDFPETMTAIDPDSLTAKVMSGPSNLFSYSQMWNAAELLRAEMPSSNGVTDARSLAKFYAAIIDDVDGQQRILPDKVLAAACEVQSDGPDKVIGIDSKYGGGYMLPPVLSADCGPSSFGHAGAGGSLGLADIENAIGFGYVMNRMRLDIGGDPRARALIQALYRSL